MSEYSLKALALALCAALMLGAVVNVFSALFSSDASLVPPAPRQAESAPQAPEQPTQPIPSARTDDSQAVIERNLFNLKKQEQAAPAQPQEQQPLPISPINYDLLGTAVHSDPQLSMAFFQEKSSRSPKAVGIGRALGDAVVVEIAQNYVVLQRNGQDEILKKKP